MPSKTPRQAKFMRAAAHDPKFAKKAGIPVKVAREFSSADGNYHGPGKRGSNAKARTSKTRSWTGK